MLPRYCVNDLEMFPFVPVITGISFAFVFHMRWISLLLLVVVVAVAVVIDNVLRIVK